MGFYVCFAQGVWCAFLFQYTVDHSLISIVIHDVVFMLLPVDNLIIC